MKINDLEPGETVVYHRGHLATDRYEDSAVYERARQAWRAYRMGLGTLAQRRVGRGFEYLFIRGAAK